jgi:glycosyltransferase involved in cell wall biosynthesis
VPEFCAVVPVFDHERAVGGVVASIRACGLPCLLIDDGSGPTCAQELDRLADLDGVELLRLPVNLGKGGAVSAGLRAAAARGFSHALQIDADGQHAAADIPGFLAASRAEPAAVICGRPVFDSNMPRVRLYGRYLTHLLVWLHTLSFDIRDSMCGFRVYPLDVVLGVLETARPGSRMDFDVAILVHLHWRGVRLRWLDTAVQYPADGISHFRLVFDNLLISRMHAALFLGMLARLPRLLARRLRGISPGQGMTS